MADFKEFCEIVNLISERVCEWEVLFSSMLQFHSKTAQVLDRAFENTGLRHEPWSTLYGAAHPDKLEHSVEDLKTAFHHQIKLPLGELAATIADIKTRNEGCEKLRADLEYYLNKLSKLRSEEAAFKQKGKPVKPKDQQRLERNEQKLKESQNTYDAAVAVLIEVNLL